MFTGRLLAISLAVTGFLMAQPSVTTIQDTIYKADGSLFSGTAVINWNSFVAGDASKVGMQTLSVPIVNGAIYVQLVPNANVTPASVYVVHYNSDGREQFTETWSVPSSSTVLRVQDVRVVPGASTGTGASTGPASIAETQVTGLSADLLLRPIKGAGYSPGRTAVINDAGEVDAVAGDPGACVRVNGTAAACFNTAALAAFIDAETPAGTIDGVNSGFTIQNAPVPSASLQLYRNGVYQTAGVDYAVSASSIQFYAGAVPQPGDMLLAYYRVGGAQATSTQQVSTTYPLTGGGSLQSNLTLGLADSAFLRRGHRTMVLGDSFAANGASWAVPGNWFAQAAVQSRSAIRYWGNAGLAGDTTSNMLVRLVTDVISKNPEKVFLAAGSTDIAAGMQPLAVLANITSIVAALKAANILPLLCSIPPVPGFVAVTNTYNLRLRKLAGQQGLPFVELGAPLVDSTTGLIAAAYGADLSNLPAPAGRVLASAAIAATSSIFDQTSPWVPSSDADGVNLITDPLFQKVPSRWSTHTVSGSVALNAVIGQDSTITGNVTTLTKTDQTSVNNYQGVAITSGFQPGDRIAFTGRIKTSGNESGALVFDAGLQYSPGASQFYSMFHWQADIRDGQWFVETVVPSGITSITPFFQLNQGTGTVVIGQIGLINLTALGL